MTSEGTLETIIAQQHGNKEVEYLSSSYRGRAFVTNRAFLTLIDVKVSDSGRYGCKLTFEGDLSIINFTILEVSGRRLFSHGTEISIKSFHLVYMAFHV